MQYLIWPSDPLHNWIETTYNSSLGTFAMTTNVLCYANDYAKCFTKFIKHQNANLVIFGKCNVRGLVFFYMLIGKLPRCQGNGMLNQSRVEMCATWLKSKVPYEQNKVKHIDVRKRGNFALLF